ncbi:MAG TPA: hypothetical protein VNO21_24595, partial [Polyangiaceae bacterium]|nr:hypothetical protein [Polyangiaceae bacterium]
MSDIHEIIQRAYAIFRRYPRKFSAATMHWTSDDPEIRAIQRRVKETKLAALDADTVQKVIWNATATAQSLKHFLPRVLECIADGSLPVSDLL